MSLSNRTLTKSKDACKDRQREKGRAGWVKGGRVEGGRGKREEGREEGRKGGMSKRKGHRDRKHCECTRVLPAMEVRLNTSTATQPHTQTDKMFHICTQNIQTRTHSERAIDRLAQSYLSPCQYAARRGQRKIRVNTLVREPTRVLTDKKYNRSYSTIYIFRHLLHPIKGYCFKRVPIVSWAYTNTYR